MSYLEAENKPTTTMVIWTNAGDRTVNIKTGKTQAKTVIGQLK
ncbi:hypothetical protein [Enterococcus olivae]